jgi:endoribonuclease Dicer
VGDAFLKLATSVHIYLSHLRKGEGDMSHVRSKSVDNAYLRRKAVQAHLPGFILSQRFRVDRFRDAQSEDGKELANGNFSRKIPRRVLSDVVEALLGVGFLTGGISAGLKVGTALDLCFGGTSPWSEREFNISFGTAAAKKTLKPSVRAGCEELQRQIGYVFKEPLLLVQALTHRSANSFVTNCYEREEWLGDAVIDMWIIEHAYKRFDQATAEELTLARAKIVSNGSLGFLAIKKLKLHELIMHHSENFQQVCAEAIEAIEPFTKIEQFFSDINNLFVVFDPPKILNDALEAIVGAVFIDSCFHLPTVYRALDRIFEDVTPGLSQLVARDPLSTMLRLRDQYQCTDLRRISSVFFSHLIRHFPGVFSSGGRISSC